MHIYKYDIVFQEVPHHISLAFYVCGCSLKCQGCHSPELWSEKNGQLLSADYFEQLLFRYSGKITCVLFLGGEWCPQDLIKYLSMSKALNLRTALYTGLDEVPPQIMEYLDFLKTGPWNQNLGGLWSPQTNQKFWDLKNKKILNHLFQSTSTEEKHD